MVGVVVRPLSFAATKVVAVARRVGAKVGGQLAGRNAAYRVLRGFLLKITRSPQAITVVVIPTPVRVVGDVLLPRIGGGGLKTVQTVLYSFPRDTLYRASGEAPDNPPYNVVSELTPTPKDAKVRSTYSLGTPPPAEVESLTSYDNLVQGGSFDNGRVVSRLVTDDPTVVLFRRVLDGVTQDPSSAINSAGFWMEVETISLSGKLDRIHIDEEWVKSQHQGYRFLSDANKWAQTPLPTTSAYRRGSRVVVAINVRKTIAPYFDPQFNESLSPPAFGGGNSRDNGHSALLLIDGELDVDPSTGEGTYVVTRSHLWELQTEADPRLKTNLWHDMPPPYEEQYMAIHLGVASNEIRPVVTIAADGEVFGAAVVTCVRTAVEGSNPEATPLRPDLVSIEAPAQSLVGFQWGASLGDPFVRTVREATYHYSGALACEFQYRDVIGQDGGDKWLSRFPWVQDYPRTVDALAGAPTDLYATGYSRGLMETEDELFIDNLSLATTDDLAWEIGVTYHRFRLADIDAQGVPSHAIGRTCANDMENSAALCVAYPTLYKRVSLPFWAGYSWDFSGIKADPYPVTDFYARGITSVAMGVESQRITTSRTGVQLAPQAWGFIGYQFDTLDPDEVQVSLMKVGAVDNLTTPPDVDSPPTFEADVPRMALAQRRVKEEVEGVEETTLEAGFFITPGSGGYYSYNAGAEWVKIYSPALLQTAFLGSALWTTSNSRAAEVGK